MVNTFIYLSVIIYQWGTGAILDFSLELNQDPMQKKGTPRLHYRLWSEYSCFLRPLGFAPS